MVQNLTTLESVDALISETSSLDSSDTVILDLSHVYTTWPNSSTYFAAAVDFLRSKVDKVIIDNCHDNQKRVHLTNPQPISSFVRYETPLTNNVWKYTSESEAMAIARKYRDALLDQVRCEEGVIDTLNWCIFEVLDNVFQHSQSTAGYAMMQLHAEQQTCTISVSDTGSGIQKSLASNLTSSRVTRSKILRADDAIEHALEQGVTRNTKTNQGNGLHGLRRAVEINGGQLNIRSGWGSWQLSNHEITKRVDKMRPLLDIENHQSTTVDWRLDCSTPVSISEALGRVGGSDLIEEIETEPGFYRIDSAEVEELVGSRSEGAILRNRILNYLTDGAPQIAIDLKLVDIISSSFADEVAGKIAEHLGESEYRRKIFFLNASTTNLDLIERSVQLRIRPV